MPFCPPSHQRELLIAGGVYFHSIETEKATRCKRFYILSTEHPPAAAASHQAFKNSLRDPHAKIDALALGDVFPAEAVGETFAVTLVVLVGDLPSLKTGDGAIDLILSGVGVALGVIVVPSGPGDEVCSFVVATAVELRDANRDTDSAPARDNPSAVDVLVFGEGSSPDEMLSVSKGLAFHVVREPMEELIVGAAVMCRGTSTAVVISDVSDDIIAVGNALGDTLGVGVT